MKFSFCFFLVLFASTTTVYSFGPTLIPHPHPHQGQEQQQQQQQQQQQHTNDATGYFLTDGIERFGAVCLDGSPPVYYHRPGKDEGMNKWFIHMQGGGWCLSMEDCYQRSLTTLGSSKKYPKTLNLENEGGYFSADPHKNPLLHNWNSVSVRYCDGASWSGNNSTVSEFNGQKLYFRGRPIVTALIADLLENRGLQSADEVIISGCSAGAIATFYHVDLFAQSVPALIVGMPDSGFFLESSSPDYVEKLQWVVETMNTTDSVNQNCLKYHTNKTECMSVVFSTPYVETPLFLLQSQYDSWQIENFLRTNDTNIINQFGTNLTTTLKRQVLSPEQPDNGVFLDSCRHHCGGWNTITIDGLTQCSAFSQWYETRRGRWFQSRSYPCSECCNP